MSVTTQDEAVSCQETGTGNVSYVCKALQAFRRILDMEEHSATEQSIPRRNLQLEQVDIRDHRVISLLHNSFSIHYATPSTHTPTTPVSTNDPSHLKQLPVQLLIPGPKIHPPPSLRLAFLPRPLPPLRLRNLISSASPHL
jgi:hypothetical protein